MGIGRYFLICFLFLYIIFIALNVDLLVTAYPFIRNGKFSFWINKLKIIFWLEDVSDMSLRGNWLRKRINEENYHYSLMKLIHIWIQNKFWEYEEVSYFIHRNNIRQLKRKERKLNNTRPKVISVTALREFFYASFGWRSRRLFVFSVFFCTLLKAQNMSSFTWNLSWPEPDSINVHFTPIYLKS